MADVVSRVEGPRLEEPPIYFPDSPQSHRDGPQVAPGAAVTYWKPSLRFVWLVTVLLGCWVLKEAL